MAKGLKLFLYLIYSIYPTLTISRQGLSLLKKRACDSCIPRRQMLKQLPFYVSLVINGCMFTCQVHIIHETNMSTISFCINCRPLYKRSLKFSKEAELLNIVICPLKIKIKVPERWFSDQKHLLLLQRVWVRLPSSTW